MLNKNMNSVNYIELIFSPEYLCILNHLEPDDFEQLSLVSSSILSLTKDLYNNNNFWKQRFERSISYVFPKDQNPGKTTWLWKYKKALEMESSDDDYHPLYFSVEIFDVKLAYQLTGCPDYDAQEIIRFHLIHSRFYNDNVGETLLFLASKPEFKMSKFLNNSGLSDVAYISIELLSTLLDPELGLNLNVCNIIYSLSDTDIEKETFLLNHPSAKIKGNVGEYFDTAFDFYKYRVVKHLLDMEDIIVTEEFIHEWYKDLSTRQKDPLAVKTLEILKTHPKTQQYVTNFMNITERLPYFNNIPT